MLKETKLSAQSKGMKILEPEFVDGNISLVELSCINQLVKKYKPKIIFEFGTFDGRTTLNLAANAPLNAKIYTLDLPRKPTRTKYKLYKGKNAVYSDNTYIAGRAVGKRFKNSKYSSKIFQLYGDSASFDYSDLFNTIDFVFIDGSHAYQYVKNDTEAAFKLLRKGKGVIVWHDYGNWPDVTIFLNHKNKTDRRFKSLKWVKDTMLVSLEV